MRETYSLTDKPAPRHLARYNFSRVAKAVLVLLALVGLQVVSSPSPWVFDKSGGNVFLASVFGNSSRLGRANTPAPSPKPTIPGKSTVNPASATRLPKPPPSSAVPRPPVVAPGTPLTPTKAGYPTALPPGFTPVIASLTPTKAMPTAMPVTAPPPTWVPTPAPTAFPAIPTPVVLAYP